MTAKQRIEQLEGLLEYDRLKRVEARLIDTQLALEKLRENQEEIYNDREHWRDKCAVLMNENQYLKDKYVNTLATSDPQPTEPPRPRWRKFFL